MGEGDTSAVGSPVSCRLSTDAQCQNPIMILIYRCIISAQLEFSEDQTKHIKDHRKMKTQTDLSCVKYATGRLFKQFKKRNAKHSFFFPESAGDILDSPLSGFVALVLTVLFSSSTLTWTYIHTHTHTCMHTKTCAYIHTLCTMFCLTETAKLMLLQGLRSKVGEQLNHFQTQKDI